MKGYTEPNNNRVQKAESAISLLKDGIDSGNQNKIQTAMAIVEDRTFNWNGLEVVKMEWDSLIKRTIKGAFMGRCNRTVCTNHNATWYNHSTRAYYCTQCARLINDANRWDSMRLYGHELCTAGEHQS